ncbi:DsbE family thiol:disulfide interchange protein [Tropicimonas isoalkanivorans]|uniref:Cytochrome c biogenesis protein CcmG, thiol:disulfide interchange protein DsbE n=1 Tax=Tropicimonas isoalkanivorans TaxID=441112 RepID=A0A1I1KB91_9RHOB|nr:DsbE family thiol:disulfide interchange protein [Tropicimonas isoalkanivorans]SFC57602.1 cytochrome c biogenesis protein CcmG, thiol:disulfide interchange protein DsbE [Tropicimonas isoalkanivorans]
MASVSPLMILPPAIFLAVAGLFYAGMNRDNPDALPTALQGKEAPGLQLDPFADKPMLTDETLRQGDVTLVNYWASWCAPCRAEHPQLMQLAADGVPVHGVNYKDEPPKAQAFLSGLGDPYDHGGADSKGRTAIDWGVYGVPETFVVDGEGTIVARFAGPITPEVLESTIRPAIAEAAGAD